MILVPYKHWVGALNKSVIGWANRNYWFWSQRRMIKSQCPANVKDHKPGQKSWCSRGLRPTFLTSTFTKSTYCHIKKRSRMVWCRNTFLICSSVMNHPDLLDDLGSGLLSASSIKTKPWEAAFSFHSPHIWSNLRSAPRSFKSELKTFLPSAFY